MAFPTQINRHTFLKTTGPVEGRNDPDTIIFFITGNPGMIRYYHEFLSLLSDNLTSLGKDDAAESQSQGHAGPYVIYGTSLAGFGGENVDMLNGTAEERYMRATTASKQKYYNLQEQIAFVEANLLSCVERWRTTQQEPEKKPKVIIVGHSVGGYISMEVLRRHRERKDDSMNLLNLLPCLALLASALVRFLVAPLPTFMLRLIVSIFMRFPPERAVDSTIDMLRHETATYETIISLDT
ncbi:hypothetical protein KEM56_000618 [Ascosphaera pollenicola]|nr:hypothetical protein KEM56_000618 [Ascosphaera pollenicola]